jgi:hypothetical protein
MASQLQTPLGSMRHPHHVYPPSLGISGMTQAAMDASLRVQHPYVLTPSLSSLHHNTYMAICISSSSSPLAAQTLPGGATRRRAVRGLVGVRASYSARPVQRLSNQNHIISSLSSAVELYSPLYA